MNHRRCVGRMDWCLLPLSGRGCWLINFQVLTDARALRRRRIHLAWRTAVISAVLLILAYFSPALIKTDPREADLPRQSENVGQIALNHFSSVGLPFDVASTRGDLDSQISRDEQVYKATVKLRLPRPLYLPAFSEGTAEYRELRQALQEARKEVKSAAPLINRRRVNFRLTCLS
jgi:hypothetical protein